VLRLKLGAHRPKVIAHPGIQPNLLDLADSSAPQQAAWPARRQPGPRFSSCSPSPHPAPGCGAGAGQEFLWCRSRRLSCNACPYMRAEHAWRKLWHCLEGGGGGPPGGKLGGGGGPPPPRGGRKSRGAGASKQGSHKAEGLGGRSADAGTERLELGSRSLSGRSASVAVVSPQQARLHSSVGSEPGT